MMPTAPKVVAAVLMAGLTYYVAKHLIVPLTPEGKSVGWLIPLSTSFAFIYGWRILGPRAPLGYNPAFGAALTAAFLTYVVSLASLTGAVTLIDSTKLRYKGPLDAMRGWVDTAIREAEPTFVPEVLVPFIGGALLVGLIAYIVSRFAR